MSEQVSTKQSNNYIIYLLLALVASVCLVGYVGYSAYQKLPEKKALTAEMPYAGFWQTETGSLNIQIFEDGTGNYKGANSNVTGGVVRIKNGMLVISFLWFDTEFKIDQPPQDGKMVLDGVTYYKLTAQPAAK